MITAEMIRITFISLHDGDVCVCVIGLIIDAFGELRDQQEQVKEDMEVSVYTHTHSIGEAKLFALPLHRRNLTSLLGCPLNLFLIASSVGDVSPLASG